MSRSLKCILIIFGILVIDQVLKIIIKTNMYYGEEIYVLGKWFRLQFVENEGMAFGMILPGENGKLVLSIFRLIAIAAISFYLHYLIKIKAHPGLLITISMIIAGAAGNMIDSAFYGLIFTESLRDPTTTAVLFPEGGGYGTFLHGKVVDMFYFPVWKGNYPEWLFGGRRFEFFRPVFNIADASITLAVVILLFRQRYFFSLMHHEKETVEEASDPGSPEQS